MVDSLDGDAWSKFHHGVSDEQKVSLAVLEELDEPEPSHDSDEPCHPQS